jgi:DNA-binding IclR family transcriptional regulator
MVDEFPRASSRVVEQACEVLLAIARDEHRPGVRGFAEELDVSKSTLQRILVALENRGFIVFSPARQEYVLGSKVLQLAAGFQQGFDLIATLRNQIGDLCESTGETVTLSVETDGYRLTVFQVPSPQELRFVTEPGRRYPLVRGATGRVLLAAMPPARLDAVLAQYFGEGAAAPGAFDCSDLSEPVVRAEVEKTAATGYAISHAEWTAGGAGLAVPLHSPDGSNAALSVYAPDSRMTESNIERFLGELRAVADDFARTHPKVGA